MKTSFLFLTLALWLTLSSGASFAAEPPPGAEAETTTTRHYKPFNQIHTNYQISLGLDMSGPLLFNDTPDATIDELTAFNYGGTLAFMFGNEIKDFHRLGLGVSYHLAARSEERKLDMITPFLTYEIGHPFILQIRTGYTLTTGTKEFAENYAGIYGGISLRYSFRNQEATSPVSVSFALAADAVLSMESAEYSSVFMGVKLEVIYHK